MSMKQLVLENVYVVRKMSGDEEPERARTIEEKPNPISRGYTCRLTQGVYCSTSGVPASEVYILDHIKYMSSDKTPKVSAESIGDTERVQPAVAASLDRSLKEHADVWAELSKY